ncbi:MAG: sulfur carrier protein ThiS [Clostridia bacterium]|nr:sulfur carrier protein ThiS [Clostridia bacterium]
MKVTLNGKQTEIDAGLTLMELLKEKGLEPDRVVVEFNHDIAPKEEWNNILLKEGDNLEVLRFVGGG